MLFAERKVKDGFNYWTEDVFGEVTIDSTVKLDGKVLDKLVLLILKQGLGAETVTGKVQHEQGVVSYELKRRPQWEDLDPEELEGELCENTPISIKQRVSVSIATFLLKVPGLNWCKRFVAVFREVWKRM